MTNTKFKVGDRIKNVINGRNGQICGVPRTFTGLQTQQYLVNEEVSADTVQCVMHPESELELLPLDPIEGRVFVPSVTDGELKFNLNNNPQMDIQMNKHFISAWKKYVKLNPSLKNDKKAKEDFKAGWNAAISSAEDVSPFDLA